MANNEKQTVGDQHNGIVITHEGDNLVITINTTFEGQPSKSGKTLTIATTHGLHNISATEYVSLNYGRKA